MSPKYRGIVYFSDSKKKNTVGVGRISVKS